MPNPLRAPELPSRAAAEIFRQVSSGLFHAELSDLITAGLESGVEWRFPFLDQQLVELMLSMPAALLFGNGVAKRPVREGLADLLPERIRTRAGFAHFSELVQRGLRDREQARRRDLLTQPLLAREGLVDPARLQAAWEQWENEPERYCSRALFVSLPVEVWLRSKEEEGAVDLANCPAD
jgi:asparagine synthase (glutamine-hydrolysing)